MSQKHRQVLHFLSSILPACLLGCASGATAGLIVTIFKFCAGFVTHSSDKLYALLRQELVWIPLAFLLMAAAAVLLSFIHNKQPSLCGGGIPASVGALRGLFSLRPILDTLGVFVLSLFTFLLGVPLGTEGPSVQMGTALGGGIAVLRKKAGKAWERFSMTGGASAGFSVATGAPLSGILFSIEEAHGHISPLIILTAFSSVLSASLVSAFLSPLLGVEVTLFPRLSLPTLSLHQLWIPLLVGLGTGLFAIGFLRSYRALYRLYHKMAKAAPRWLCLFIIFGATLLLGLFSDSFIFTGHHLITELIGETPSLFMLLLIVLIRSTLTLSATSAGITGGIFLPLMAIGAAFSAFLAKLFVGMGMAPTLIPTVIALGICACIAGMMKMPLTAVLFAVEALGLSTQLVPVILTATAAFALPEFFGEESIGEMVLDRKEAALDQDLPTLSGSIQITVAEGTFAVGKQIRDILWPHGVRVLSVQRAGEGDLFAPGDIITLHYTTRHKDRMEAALSAIAGSEITPLSKP